MKKYRKDLSTWANNVGSKEALENPHNLIRSVTDSLEIHQRLHSVGNQRSRERTPCIKLVSRRSSSFSTGVDWKQVTTPRFARKLYFRFFLGVTSMITRKLNRPRIVSYTHQFKKGELYSLYSKKNESVNEISLLVKS